MNGVENRLNYLEDTKTAIKNAIISIGGEVEEDTEFDEYSGIISNVAQSTIIPQSTLDSFMNTVESINGEVVENDT